MSHFTGSFMVLTHCNIGEGTVSLVEVGLGAMNVLIYLSGISRKPGRQGVRFIPVAGGVPCMRLLSSAVSWLSLVEFRFHFSIAMVPRCLTDVIMCDHNSTERHFQSNI